MILVQARQYSMRHKSLPLAVYTALVLVLVGSSPPASGGEVSLRAMTFNTRNASGATNLIGQNGWYDLANLSNGRYLKAEQVITDNAPDIIGTQELISLQVDDFAGMSDYPQFAPGNVGLSGYSYYGVGRDDGVAAGEYAAIFYRTDRFTQLDAGTFWLSQTPDVPGSQYPGAGTVRIASWVILEDNQSHQQLFVLDTHLDNVSNSANVYSANLIQSRLPSLSHGLPVLLLGDFNSTESSTVVHTMLGQNNPAGVQLSDAYRVVHPVQQSDEATFHDFTGNTYGPRIDFILSSDAFTPQDAEIIHTSYDGKYPSDHFPVVVDFSLAVVPEPSSVVLAALAAALLVAVRCRPRESTDPRAER